MKLVYINELGPDYKGDKIYEFIFSDNVKNVYGEDWDLAPASGRAKPPDIKFIKVVGNLSDTELKLELAQNSDHFSLLDAVDEVVALGWESFDIGDDTKHESRLVFKFGEGLDIVKTKLTKRNLELKTINIK